MEKNGLLKNNKFKRIFMIVFLLLAGLLAVFLFLGKAKVFKSTSILGRTFNAQASATKFVVVSDSSNKNHTIYMPTSAKNKQVHVYYKKSGAGSWEADVTRYNNPGASQNIKLTKKQYDKEVFRILVKCDLSGSAWKPSGWNYNSDIGWAYKDFTITWPTNNTSSNTSTSKPSSGGTTTTASENICSIAPGAYTVKAGNAGTAKITCSTPNGWQDAKIIASDISSKLLTNVSISKIGESRSTLEYQVNYYASSTTGTASISLKAGSVKNSNGKTNTAASTSFSVTSDRRSTPTVSQDIDKVKPSCSIAFASSTITSGGNGTATITCSDTGFNDTNIYNSDFTNSLLTNFKIIGGSVSMGTVTKNVSFTASSTTGTGKMTLKAGSVVDKAGNRNEAVSKTITIKSNTTTSKPTTTTPKPSVTKTPSTLTLKVSQYKNSLTKATIGSSVTVNSGERLYFWPTLSNSKVVSASYTMNSTNYGTINGNEFVAANSRGTIKVTAIIKDEDGKSYKKLFSIIIQNNTETPTTETPKVSALTIKTAQVSGSLTRATIGRTVTIEAGKKLYFWATLSNTKVENVSYTMNSTSYGTITGNEFTSNGNAGTINVTATVMGADKRQYHQFFSIKINKKEVSVSKPIAPVKSTLTVKVTQYKASPTRATIGNSVTMNAGDRLFFWPSLDKSKIVNATYSLNQNDYGTIEDNSFISNGKVGRIIIKVVVKDQNYNYSKSFYVNIKSVSNTATPPDIPKNETPTNTRKDNSGPRCSAMIYKTAISINETVNGTMSCKDVSGFNNPSFNNYSFGFDSNVIALKLGEVIINNNNNILVNFTVTGKKAGKTSFGLKSNKLMDKVGNNNVNISLIRTITVQQNEQVVEKSFNDVLVHVKTVKVEGNTVVITAYGATHYCVTTTNDKSKCNWTTNNRISTPKYKVDQKYYVFVKDKNYESTQASEVTVPGTKTRFNNNNVGPTCHWTGGIGTSATVRAEESINIGFICEDEDKIGAITINKNITVDKPENISINKLYTSNNINIITLNAKSEGSVILNVSGIKDEFGAIGQNLSLNITIGPAKKTATDNSGNIIYYDLNNYKKVHELDFGELECIAENIKYNKVSVGKQIKNVYAAANANGMNVFLFLAQTSEESAYYNSSIFNNCNNPGGWKGGNCHGEYRRFDSAAQGLRYVADKINDNYLTPGASHYYGLSIADLQTDYCPNSDFGCPGYPIRINSIANKYVTAYKQCLGKK